MIRSLCRCRVLLTVLAVAAAAPATVAADVAEAAPDLATVLARHVEARGGAERWARISGVKLTGTWEAFSTPGPFTVYRGAPDRWRFEHVLFGQPAVLAYDGEHPWVQGAALGIPVPTRLDAPWARNLIADASLRTPLIAGPGDGVELELVGREPVEGRDAWIVRVVREGFPDETWYLDADSYLEIKRESRTFDVFSGGIEIPMETYWDDFRDVDGVVMPFHEERHFGTRYHVTDVDAITVDPELADGLFEAPPPPEPDPAAADGDGTGDPAGS